jgi:hypothetical protein
MPMADFLYKDKFNFTVQKFFTVTVLFSAAKYLKMHDTTDN